MGNAKICGQKLRMSENDTVRTKEDLERSAELHRLEHLKPSDRSNQLQASAHKKDITNAMLPKSPEEAEISSYHNAYQLQMDYFSEAEVAYYESMLKLEKLNRKDNRLKKKIRCKEDKLLGAGSFGTVTRGFCVNNRLTMAVKRINLPHSAQERADINDLQKEVVLLAELKHPNIVAYYDSETDGECLKIYLEFVDMGSIAHMLKTYGPFPDEVVARYTKQILEGLEYLHYHGVMHRDVKGANILVHSNGSVKLADFGSAKKIKNYASSFIGTVCWMAPEAS